LQRKGPWVLWRKAHKHFREKSTSLMEKKHWGLLERITKENEVWKSCQTKGNDGVEQTMIF